MITNWDTERLDSVGGGDETTVTVGLFLKTLPLLYLYLISTIEFLVPLHGTEIGGTEEYRHLDCSKRSLR